MQGRLLGRRASGHIGRYQNGQRMLVSAALLPGFASVNILNKDLALEKFCLSERIDRIIHEKKGTNLVQRHLVDLRIINTKA